MQIKINKTETVDLTEREEAIYNRGLEKGFKAGSVFWLICIFIVIAILILIL